MPVVRLIDVAKAAGVSRGTASNVFNAPDMVRPALRKRVEAAARALSYIGPDPKARVMRSGKFNAIGVVPPAHLGVAESLKNPVYRQFLLGVGEACDAVGANFVLVSDMTEGAGIKTALVDGFIFGRLEHLDLLNLAKLRRLPFAVIDVEPGRDINSVRIDSRAGAYEAARHLINLGHRKFGIVSVFRDLRPACLHRPGAARPIEIAGMHTDQDKLKGYAQALAEAGLDIDSVPIVQAQPWDPDAAGLMLDAAPEATAILSMSVMQGIAVMSEAKRRGITVPRDLSVVGFNDTSEARRCDPPLTTVDARGVERGRIAAEIVFANGPPRQEVLQPRLIIRGSTAAAPSRWLRW
jgi:DNA-binding LacI/PurR family transcriptional regulator